MPSKSKSQQRFFGMVDAYKKGELKNPSKSIKKAANGMSMSDVKDFAETKHDGLPETVGEETVRAMKVDFPGKTIRLTENDLKALVREATLKVLNEAYNDMNFDSGIDDNELHDELEAAGATGKATESEIFGWEEDLWINVNKTLQNANYLFNKTRDERYAKIAKVISGVLELFPSDAENRYMGIDYDSKKGYGG